MEYAELLKVLDTLIDNEQEAGWERTLEVSAYEDIAEYRNTQQVSSNVIDTARALVGALIVQHRVECMS